MKSLHHRVRRNPSPLTTDMTPRNHSPSHRLTASHHSTLPTWRFVTLTVFLGLPVAGVADSISLPNVPFDPQSATAPNAGSVLIAPFRYIPPAGAPKNETPGMPVPTRTPEQQRIVDLNAAGDYRTVGTEGLALIAKEKPDDELQLIVANSLAWTGRLKEAIPTYQGLTQGKLVNEANVGLANVYRWRGRDDQAAPLYRAVLANIPDNADALEGLELATRELSPRTTLSFGGASDSSDIQRRSATINHRWRDKSGANIMEIETSGVRDSLPNIQARQQDVTLRYEGQTLALKPSAELSMPTSGDRTLYGSVRVKLAEDQVSLSAGRVNWGRMATNPNALASRLAASHVGLTAVHAFSFGTLRARVDHFDISDNNRILSGSLHVASTWRPIGNNFKPFVGVQTRDAKFSSPSYWSPEQGSGTLYAGLLGEWGSADWNFYASAQSGTGLYGDAGTSWSVSGGGKRWLSNDVALSMNFWSMASWRDNAAYRAQSATVSLEKLWR